MKFINFASYVRKQTKTDSTSFPNADITLFANIAKDDLAEEIVQLDEDYFDLTLTTDIVADQREYSFPADMLKNIKMVELKLDGTNWKRMKEFDLNSYRLRQESRVRPYNALDIGASFSGATTDETTIQETFSDDFPEFDIDGESIVIYTRTAPIAVTDGIKLRATIYPTDYVDADWAESTDISVRSSSISTALARPSHEVLARKTIILFKESNQIALDPFDLNFETELQQMRNKLKQPNMDRVITPRVPRDTGFTY